MNRATSPRHSSSPPAWLERGGFLIMKLILPADGAVDIWTARLNSPVYDLDRLSALLSPDERARQGRMLAGRVRDRFTVARASLRLLLGRYLASDPAAIEFTYGPRGKPSLAAGGGGLRFNLAHSEDLAVYAIARGHEVGVDVERIREVPDLERIARRFFAPEERAVLASLPAADRLRSFYLAWTRKEAYIKAVGDGLHIPLDSFSVSLGPREPARLTRLNVSPELPENWNLHHLETESGFVGAVAYLAPPKILNLLTFSDLSLETGSCTRIAPK